MKKLILLGAILLVGLTSSYSQELGLRFGDVSGGNVAVDVVFSAGSFNRLHADLSFGNEGLGVDFLWDFFYKSLSGEAFNWYIGAGPYAFLGEPFQLGLVGEIGIEYHFNGVPICIGGDWRPAFSLVENTDFFFRGFGLNVRWVF